MGSGWGGGANNCPNFDRSPWDFEKLYLKNTGNKRFFSAEFCGKYVTQKAIRK